MEHLLIEVYLEDDVDLNQDLEQGSKLEALLDGSRGYTITEHEIVYAGKNGFVHEIEDSIGFGGEMDIEGNDEETIEKRTALINLWNDICRKKIDEAYEEYMKKKEEFLK